MSELQVELVAPDRKIWSGTATMVLARTLDGELGILPGHTPVLGVLQTGAVRIDKTDGEVLLAVVDGGFLSLANDRISILAEGAELAEEIDVAAAEAELARLRSDRDPDVEAQRRAEARLQAAEGRGLAR